MTDMTQWYSNLPFEQHSGLFMIGMAIQIVAFTIPGIIGLIYYAWHVRNERRTILRKDTTSGHVVEFPITTPAPTRGDRDRAA